MKYTIYLGATLYPPTKAHVLMAKKLCEYYKSKGDDFEILVAPVYVHAFSGKSGAETYEQRCEMAELTFAELVKQGYPIKVSRLDEEVSIQKGKKQDGSVQSVYTFEVLEKLRKDHLENSKNKDNKIILALGADTYRDLISGFWSNADKFIKDHCDGMMVFDREDKELKTPDQMTEEEFNAWALKVAEERIKTMPEEKRAAALEASKTKIPLIASALYKKANFIAINAEKMPDDIKNVSSTKARESFVDAKNSTEDTTFAYMLAENMFNLFNKTCESLSSTELKITIEKAISDLRCHPNEKTEQLVTHLTTAYANKVAEQQTFVKQTIVYSLANNNLIKEPEDNSEHEDKKLKVEKKQK